MLRPWWFARYFARMANPSPTTAQTPRKTPATASLIFGCVQTRSIGHRRGYCVRCLVVSKPRQFASVGRFHRLHVFHSAVPFVVPSGPPVGKCQTRERPDPTMAHAPRRGQARPIGRLAFHAGSMPHNAPRAPTHAFTAPERPPAHGPPARPRPERTHSTPVRRASNHSANRGGLMVCGFRAAPRPVQARRARRQTAARRLARFPRGLKIG